MYGGGVLLCMCILINLMEAGEVEKLKEGWTLTHCIQSKIKQYPPKYL